MRKHLSIWIASCCFAVAACEQPVSAGQLMDAWLNSKRPAYPVAANYPYAPTYGSAGYYGASGYYSAVPYYTTTPVAPNYTAPHYASVVSNYGSYASPPSATGLSAIPLGAPQTVSAYLPTATYDTVWNQTPVTYYRPVTAFDPRTGTTVTSLQPCTSYQYSASRVPLVAPRALLGDYGMQANKWPGITGPGAYPTALTNSAYYPGYQQLPVTGIPYASSIPATVPLGTSGMSTGMPASSLPSTTFQSNYPTTPIPTIVGSPAITSGAYVTPYSSPSTYPVPSAVVPAGSYSAQYPSAPVSSSQPQTIQSYQSPAYALPNSGTSNCPNGTCPISMPTSGATGVNNNGTIAIPVGPPTYSPLPSSASPSGSNFQPVLPSASPSPNGSQPFGNILPNSGAAGGTMDPGAYAVPSLGTQAASPKLGVDSDSTGREVASLRTVPTDRSAITAPSNGSVHAGLLPSGTSDASASNSSSLMNRPVNSPTPIPIPSTLTLPTTNKPSSTNAGPSSGISPLSAPDGVETKAKWNPALINPDDLTVQQRNIRNSLVPMQFAAETKSQNGPSPQMGESTGSVPMMRLVSQQPQKDTAKTSSPSARQPYFQPKQ